MFLGRAPADDGQAIARGEVEFLGNERRRRSIQTDELKARAGRGRRGVVPRQTQCVGSLLDTPKEQTEVHQGSYFMERELELGHDTEVAPTAA